MIYSIAETAATLIDVAFLIWFHTTFFQAKLNCRKNIIALVFPLLLLVFLLISDYLFAVFDMLAMAIIIVIVLGYALLLCEKMWGKAILATSLFVIIEMFTGSLLFMLFDNFIGIQADILQGATAPARLIYLSIAKLVQFVLYKLLLLFFEKSERLDKKNGFMLLLFSMLTIFGLGALMIVASNNKNDQLNVPILTILFILLLTNFAVYFFVRQLMEMQKNEYEYKMFNERINFEHKRSEEAAVIWDNIRKIRHDLKNHFTILKGMLEQQKGEECIEYIDKMYPKIESMGNLVHTDNSIIDYLINTKIPSETNINVIVSGFTNIFNDVEDHDLVSLLGNVLDNAFEAVSKIKNTKKKQIELHFLIQNQNRIILCRNTIADSVLKNNKSFKSTKAGTEHGFGHLIVNSVAQKYGGFVSYTEKSGMFCVQIVLPKKA